MDTQNIPALEDFSELEDWSVTAVEWQAPSHGNNTTSKVDESPKVVAWPR
jgi:hypothetical protein